MRSSSLTTAAFRTALPFLVTGTVTGNGTSMQAAGTLEVNGVMVQGAIDCQGAGRRDGHKLHEPRGRFNDGTHRLSWSTV